MDYRVLLPTQQQSLEFIQAVLEPQWQTAGLGDEKSGRF